MARYQIGWSQLERHNVTSEQVCAMLRGKGAVNVRERHAFGWSNQPRTPTFTASTDWEARAMAHPFTCYDIAGE